MDGYRSTLSAEQANLMERHLMLVMEANKNVNLTRIEGWEEGMLLHVEDSLTSLPEVNDCMEGPLADLGSGAGFPGIPLAIATRRKTLLIDMRKKKMSLVREMIEELGLNAYIETYAGRAELLAKTRKGEFSVVTARALSKLSTLMELASPLLKQGGCLVCYKAHVEEEELDNATRVQNLLGMKLKSDRKFLLGSDHQRRILVFEKKGVPKVKLPRQEGQAQKNPL